MINTYTDVVVVRNSNDHYRVQHDDHPQSSLYCLLTINVTVSQRCDTNDQFVFLAVDNHSSDLLVHEDQYSGKQSWQDGGKYPVPSDVERVHQPTSAVDSRRLIQHTQQLTHAFSSSHRFHTRHSNVKTRI